MFEIIYYDIKGIVHPKMKIMLLIFSPSGLQDVGDFFISKTVKKIFSWNCGPFVIHKVQVNGYRHFESQKKAYQAKQNE